MDWLELNKNMLWNQLKDNSKIFIETDPNVIDLILLSDDEYREFNDIPQAENDINTTYIVKYKRLNDYDGLG